jgi:hypothetical protein
MVEMSDMHYARAHKEVRALNALRRCPQLGRPAALALNSYVPLAGYDRSSRFAFQVTEYLSAVGALYSNDAALGSDRDSEVRVSAITDSAAVALFMKYVSPPSDEALSLPTPISC